MQGRKRETMRQLTLDFNVENLRRNKKTIGLQPIENIHYEE